VIRVVIAGKGNLSSAGSNGWLATILIKEATVKFLTVRPIVSAVYRI
jgi:hypothetical protein